jgi:peptidyl-prolyl cis-trans isomerase D
VRLFAVLPGQEASLAQARPKVEAEVKTAAGANQAYQLVRKYVDARGGGADMAAAAKSIDQAVQTLAPITVKGATLEGQSAGLPPKVLQAAFALSPGADSNPIDVGKGDYYVVHLDKVLPPAVPTLEEIRPKLTQYLVLRSAAQKLQKKADELSAAISKGQSLQDAAASVGAQVSHADGVLRNAAGPLYSADLIGRLFAAKPKAVVVGEDVRLGFAVARLDAVTPATPSALATVMASQRPEITKSLFEDLVQSARAAARLQIKPHLDYARARKAIGGGSDAGASGS